MKTVPRTKRCWLVEGRPLRVGATHASRAAAVHDRDETGCPRVQAYRVEIRYLGVEPDRRQKKVT